ncbi:MAG: phospholipase A [Acidiferrobacterales bacterium]
MTRQNPEDRIGSLRGVFVLAIGLAIAGGRVCAQDAGINPGSSVPAGSSAAGGADVTPAEKLIPTVAAVQKRHLLEEQTESNKFVIIPFKPNYILPLTYNSHQSQTNQQLQNTEVKFQLSFKIPLSDHLFNTRARFAFGYTQLSFWQAYNSKLSSPFRETDYEPELMLGIPTNTRLPWFTNRLVTFGLEHQSNGQGMPDSRSWNRAYVNFILEHGSFYLSFRPWYRFPERAKTSALDPGGDDNPDIENYLGHGELTGIYLWGNSSLTVMLRNNLKSHDNRGAIEVDWSIPLKGKLRGYVQYFNGYGESLSDYNRYSSRIGIGILLTNWL